MKNKSIFVIIVEPIGDYGGMINFDMEYMKSLVDLGIGVKLVTYVDNVSLTMDKNIWPLFNGIYGKSLLWVRGLRYFWTWMKILNKAKN